MCIFWMVVAGYILEGGEWWWVFLGGGGLWCHNL